MSHMTLYKDLAYVVQIFLSARKFYFLLGLAKLPFMYQSLRVRLAQAFITKTKCLLQQ